MNRFEEIMDSIIEEMEINAKMFEEDDVFSRKEELGPYQYVSEFRTVHLGYGRRIGKTRYIEGIATSADVILVGNARMKRFINTPADIFTSKEILDMSAEDIIAVTKSTIYVDEPHLIDDLDKVLKRLVVKYDQTVVMMGN